MVKRIKKIIFKNYHNFDIFEKEKIKSVKIISEILLFLVPFILIIYLIYGKNNIIIISSLIIVFFIILFYFIFLLNGYLFISSHVLLVTVLSVVWISLFANFDKDPITVMDTIVYLFAALSLSPLVVLRKKSVIFVYYLVNILIFCIFVYTIKVRYNLNFFTWLDYFINNVTALLALGIFSYLIFQVHNKTIMRYIESQMEIEAQNENLNHANFELETLNQQLCKTRNEIEKSENKYRLLYENALIGMITIRISDCKIINANEEAYKILGYKKKNLDSENFYFRDINIDPKRRDCLKEKLFNEKIIYEQGVKIKHNDGSLVWIAISARLNLKNDSIEAIFTDISRQKTAEENIHKLTYYDSLTNLPNQKLFSENITVEIQKTKRKADNIFAVICVGIDNFKNVNDIHGHAAGDKLLVLVSQSLKNIFREYDMVSRFSGDKFMVLLTDIFNSDNVINIIRKIFKAFEDNFKFDDKNIKVTVSCGISMFPDDGATSEVLIKNSETALYNAKDQGKNRYHFFDAKLNGILINRIKLVEELKSAIKNNELVVYYQPKYNAAGIITGMESLVRWNSPNRGLIRPDEFIPLAEKSNMIVDIDDIVLKHACKKIKKWHKNSNHPLCVSVNVSPIQLCKHKIVKKIQKILEEVNIPPECLELEIIERGIMDYEESAIDVLNSLHDMGVRISIDDFGTGYSSLSKLKDFPIDTIKIDKSFIDNLPYDEKSVKITTTIIDLAHNLGFKVVAEGVETQKQLDFLVKLNCDNFQGYFFSKPISAEDFDKKIIS